MLHGKSAVNFNSFLSLIKLDVHENTRLNYRKDGQTRIYVNISFLNSLPNSVVDASTVNAFKARLDMFWSHQAVKYDFTADLTGTRNRSEEVTKFLLSSVSYTHLTLPTNREV